MFNIAALYQTLQANKIKMVSNNLHVLKQQTPKKSSGPIQNSIIHAPI